MTLIIVKSYCPVCGIHTTVELTPYELNKYKMKGTIPNNFYDNSLCNCCKDDGLVLNKSNLNIYDNIVINL